MAKVVVNYGHGENTYREKKSKGVTVNGVAYSEHTHNYEVGTRVVRILREHGIEVLETQPANGRDVPLADRVNAADNWKADLYYSIHANAGDPAARGWCGFYWNNSADGKRIAQLYAEEMAAIGLPLYHNGIWGCIDGTWNAFYELKYTDMVAIIAENGFMTNAEDFKYIFQNFNGHWDKSAVAHAKAILRYFGIAYKTPAPVVAPVSTQRHIKIVNVSSAAIMMDRPDRINGVNIGTIPLGTIVDMIVPVTGYNNPDYGYYKIVYGGKTGYINAKYGIEV